MIARIWTGRVRAADADRYVALMRGVAIPDYRSVEGNRGAWCLHRPDGDEAVVTMLTFWRDLESIRGFAGEPIDRAKYYPFDQDFLLALPETVEHYMAEGAPGGAGSEPATVRRAGEAAQTDPDRSPPTPDGRVVPTYRT